MAAGEAKPSLGAPKKEPAAATPGAEASKPAVSTPLAQVTSTPAVAPAAPGSLPVAASFPSSLKGKTLEEIVTGWNEDLEAQVAEFQKQAVEIGHWDQRIIQNGERLLALNDRVAQLEAAQGDLEQSLNYVVAQQSELEMLLGGIERELGAAGQGAPATPDDRERDQVYAQAGLAQDRITDVSHQLAAAVEAINKAAAAQDGEQPVASTVQVLNAHLEALQWIEAQVKGLKVSTEAVQQLAAKSRLEQQRQH